MKFKLIAPYSLKELINKLNGCDGFAVKYSNNTYAFSEFKILEDVTSFTEKGGIVYLNEDDE